MKCKVEKTEKANEEIYFCGNGSIVRKLLRSSTDTRVRYKKLSEKVGNLAEILYLCN